MSKLLLLLARNVLSSPELEGHFASSRTERGPRARPRANEDSLVVRPTRRSEQGGTPKSFGSSI